MKLAHRRTFMVLTFVAFLSPLRAVPNEQKEIQELYRTGLGGNKAAVEECIEKLEVVLKDQPGNQLARVYLGSAYPCGVAISALGRRNWRH